MMGEEEERGERGERKLKEERESATHELVHVHEEQRRGAMGARPDRSGETATGRTKLHVLAYLDDAGRQGSPETVGRIRFDSGRGQEDLNSVLPQYHSMDRLDRVVREQRDRGVVCFYRCCHFGCS